MLHVKFLILFCHFIGLVCGHGRLLDPPSRSSMWRKGFNTPRNYDDNGLYCGGFNRQWNVNGGKCGICGDPYDGARQNEAGGTYATGTISASYRSGQDIDITVQITANHLGWFEFRLCPHNNPSVAATQSCLDRYKLHMADGTGRTRYHIHSRTGMITQSWKLPYGLVCTQCVLQWKYHAGNNWGYEDNGHGCKGCGKQEEFYGCADIAISDTATRNETRPIYTPIIQQTTTQSPISNSGSCRPSYTYRNVAGMTQWCINNCAAGNCPTSHCTCTQSRSLNSGSCRPSYTYRNVAGMTQWCINNCAAGHCPTSHCTCTW